MDWTLWAGFVVASLIVGLIPGPGVTSIVGYALTATFTVLVVIALGRTLPRWLAVAGHVAAALIATGVVVPLVEAASLTNFAGYVLWCGWLLALAAVLWRVPATTPVRPDRQLASSGG